METSTYLLEDLRQLAYDAYRGSSFSPEKRAQSVVEDYSSQLSEDLAGIPGDQRERYIQNYRQKLSAYLSAMSRTYSPMISGPSNFPVRQMEKRNQTVRNRSEDFTQWRERALNAIAKSKLAARSEGEVINDEWKGIEQRITSAAGTIMGIDDGTERGYARPLFVNVITGTIKTLAKNGKVELVNRSLDLVKTLNKFAVDKGGKVVIAGKNSIWTLAQAVEVAREQAVDREAQENEIEMITDIEIVKNYKINRLQILFPTKPNEEIRAKLKGRAFRWSPTEGAWQRQLTRDAESAVRQIFREVGILNETNDPEMLGRLAMHG